MTEPIPDRPPRVTLVARDPVDLLATVPVVLGFHPAESLVMLTFGRGQCLHARVDLPPSAAEVDTLVNTLAEPARRAGVTQVVLVAYAASPDPADAVLAGVATGLRAGGVVVLETIRTDGRRWFSPHPEVDPAGVPYDIGGHRFLADAVLRGEVTFGSRADLAELIAPVPGAVAEVERAVWARVHLGAKHQRAAEGAWVRHRVRRAAETQERLSDADVARLLVALADRWVRDESLTLLRRATAEAYVELWVDVVRRAPEGLVAAPATLLGFASWLRGQGALAWCALDRAELDDPGYTLAGYLAVALQHGLSPAVWDDLQNGALPGPSTA